MSGYVLVVDDDRDIRFLISSLLADEGYEVATAANGAVALDLIRKAVPDLILLDAAMPVMDGSELARRCRAGLAPRVPIVVLTAALDPAARAAEIGANDLLPKPFDLRELLALVRRYAGVKTVGRLVWATLPIYPASAG